VLEASGPLLAALGGAGNVRGIEAVAHTRLRVELREGGRFDEAGARLAGAEGVLRISASVIHLIVGDRAGQFARAMQGAG